MKYSVRHGDREVEVEVTPLIEVPGAWQVEVGDTVWQVDRSGEGPLRSLRVLTGSEEGRQAEVSVLEDGPGVYSVANGTARSRVEVLDPLTRLAGVGANGSGRAGAGRVSAVMPGRVVAILAQEGETVTVGQGVLVLEAMKMENEIRAETEGTLKTLSVEVDQAVEAGDPLFEIG